jgi:demethylmenaquinone methyltransferase/2-methoxy-6-polyprenyl-1,4-benzoquinol methylase
MKEKSRAVQKMFDQIAGRYDLMNRLMTFGQDQAWRRSVVRAAALPRGGVLLDAGTGTGRIAEAALQDDPLARAVGLDFSIEMMRAGRQRITGGILWCAGDALHLPFKRAGFDAVTSGYLIRNVSDAVQAFSEQARVVKPGGRVVCLDTSPPPDNGFRSAILFFLNTVIPFLGQMISSNRSAYTYLPESTKEFFKPEQLAHVMRTAGLANVMYRRFMFGTIAVVVGTKPYTLTGSRRSCTQSRPIP